MCFFVFLICKLLLTKILGGYTLFIDSEGEVKYVRK